MRKVRLILLLALLLIGCSGSVPPGDYRHAQPSEYYLYLPQDYTPERQWPIFVGIHGSGGSGRDCWSLWQSYADKAGFVLICPSLADAGGGWYQSEGERKVVDIVNHVYQNYSVDPRMFLVGFSAGAQFVTGLAAQYHDWVKGAVILSAGNYMLPDTGAKHVPYLIIIGENDNPTSIRRAQGFYETLHSHGFDARLEILPGVGHTVTPRMKSLTMEWFRSANRE